MYFLGILSIFQILFFPGLIFKALYKPKGKFFFQLAVVAAISMLFNYLVFYAFIYMHIYTRTVVLVVIALEVVALLYLYRGIFRTRLDETAGKVLDYVKGLVDDATGFFKDEKLTPAARLVRNLVIVIVFGLAISLTIWFCKRSWNNFGTVFVNWDAVVSWNAWAQVWAQDQVPNIHLTYPQLLPINLSLTYILIGDYHISLFAKAVMSAFALLTVLTVFELGFEKKQYGYLFAVVLVYLLYKKFLGAFITDGYADIPVAFMAWIALIPFIRSDDLLEDRKEFILSMLLAVAASLTKQVGLYVLALLPVISVINTKNRAKKQILFSLAVLGIGILLVLTWYLPRGIDVLQGREDLGLSDYINHASGVQDSTDPFTRMGLALLALGKYLALLALLIPAFFMFKKKYKLLIVGYLIPFTLLWGMVASYSERNLSIIFPLLAVMAGLTLAALLDFGCRLLGMLRFGRWSAVVLVILVLLPFLYFGIRWNDQKLTALWEEKQMQIFSPEINQQVYALDFSREQCQTILTNYPVKYLPGMENRQINFYFNDTGAYFKFITDPTICWMLVPLNSQTDEVEADIEAKLADGTYQLLFSSRNWVPYDLIQIR